ncbi:centromere protein R isoform 2-T2 [Anomaloglossus baeobatrachus]|uniref:centromere protein R isoform X2 n=1 Tax=Anomaloglossus baeobatrachus TaxID=238106 RepID=UPI003F4FA111
MPAKRSLRLEASERNQNEKSRVNEGQDPRHYSPLTGTRRMSPSSASKRRLAADAEEQKTQNDANPRAAEPETSSRGQSAPEENADILHLFSEVEASLSELLEIRQQLSDLQAEEGSRELGNLLGLDSGTLDLQLEMQKTKVLICEVRKIKKRPRIG